MKIDRYVAENYDCTVALTLWIMWLASYQFSCTHEMQNHQQAIHL